MGAAVQFTAVLDDPDNADLKSAAMYNLAVAHELMGDHQAALAGLQAYRDQYPGDDRAPDVAHQMASIYDTAGQWNEAIAEYEAAIELKLMPTLVSECLFRLGFCREQIDDVDGALKAYERARKMDDPADPYRLSSIAQIAAIYESREEYERALAAYKDLIKDAEDPELVAAATGRASEIEAALH